MTKTTRFGMRGLRGAVAAAVVLGLAHPALAWDQPQWVRQLGKTGTANGVATDIDGNVYIAGWFDGSLLAKYSAAGALRWTRQLGTCCYDIAGVATDRDGNVYIAGWTGLGALVAKYSAAGVLRWKRQLGTSEWDTAYGVATDGDGNVYIAGYTEGSLGAAQRGNGDAWVAKYSAAGVLRWKRQLGTSEWDTAMAWRPLATAPSTSLDLTGPTATSQSIPRRAHCAGQGESFFMQECLTRMALRPMATATSTSPEKPISRRTPHGSRSIPRAPDRQHQSI